MYPEGAAIAILCKWFLWQPMVPHQSCYLGCKETTPRTSGSVAGLSFAAALPFSLVLDPARDISISLGQSGVHYLENTYTGFPYVA